MKVVIKEVGEDFRFADIGNDTEDLETVVEGGIEIIYISLDGIEYALCVNDMGKLNQLTGNFVLVQQNNLVDTLVGNVVLMHEVEGKDLVESDLDRILAYYSKEGEFLLID